MKNKSIDIKKSLNKFLKDNNHFVIKDLNSNYIACSETVAKEADLDSPKSIKGKNDYDIIWRDSADSFILGDRNILNGNSKINSVEAIKTSSGIHKILVTKAGLYNVNGDGVFYCKVYNPSETKTKQTWLYQSDYTLHNYGQSGSLEDWKNNIASLCINNTRLTFAVSLAFAGPLMGLLGSAWESGGFHLLGESSIGKSTLLAVAASVYGGNYYVHDLRATENVLGRFSGITQSCVT